MLSFSEVIFGFWQRRVDWWKTADTERRLAAVVVFLASALVWAQPLPGGPRVPALLLMALSLWLVFRYRGADFPRESVWFAYLWGALAAIIALSLIGAPKPSAGIGYAVIALGFAVATLAVGWAATRLPDVGEILRKVLALTFFVFLVDGLFQYAFGYDLIGVPYNQSYYEGRLVGPFPDSIRFSSFLAMLFPFAAWPLRRKYAFVLGLWFLTVWLVLLSGFRSSFVLLLLTSIPIFWFWPKRFLVVVGVGVLIIGALAVGLSKPLTVRAINTYEGTLSVIHAIQSGNEQEADKALDKILTYRWELWRNAVKMGNDHPFLGVGAKQYRHVYAQYSDENDVFHNSDPFHAHHLYFALWAEMGVMGLLWLLAMIVLGVTLFLRSDVTARQKCAPWAIALAAYAFPVQSQPVLLTVQWLPVVWLLLTGFSLSVASHRLTTKDTLNKSAFDWK
ncbi:O-antigen ligase family protein [Hydrogenophilus thermoluteolus]|uniref:O-antigen ligase family protein n=1 Tax=Hydrogenophilus thermoluteolus TaxID=297 RepID=A0A2Z6E0V3_HYDTE|nr:O-antigen ligase family protein [Hydrogenophilus thermoluteolus]BBD78219.1 O-antigen ligase family protein [Hydrogenophilus thermoluteolus]